MQEIKVHFQDHNMPLTWGNVRSSHLSLTSVDGAWLVVCLRVKRAAPTVLCGGLPGIAGAGLAFVLPAGVGLDDGQAEFFELVEELAQAALVVEPAAVVGELVVGQEPGDGFAGDLAGPLVVGAVQGGRVGVAAAAGVAAAHGTLGEGAGEGEADLGDRGGDAGGLGALGRGGRHVLSVASGVPGSRHISQYKSCVIGCEVAGYVARWRTVAVSGQAAGFARRVVMAAAPGTRARANALL